MLQGRTQAFGSYSQLLNSGTDFGSRVQGKETPSLYSEEGTAESKPSQNDIESELHLHDFYVLTHTGHCFLIQTRQEGNSRQN